MIELQVEVDKCEDCPLCSYDILETLICNHPNFSDCMPPDISEPKIMPIYCPLKHMPLKLSIKSSKRKNKT